MGPNNGKSQRILVLIGRFQISFSILMPSIVVIITPKIA